MSEIPQGADQDEFLMKLSAANPVDDRTAPSPQDAAAQQLLENVMNAENTMEAGSASYGMADGTGAPQVIGASPASPVQNPRRRNAGRGMLVGAAAAVLLLFGGLLVFLPENTPSAVATVRSAAAAAADADTGRIETTFTASGTDGEEQGQLEGSFQASYSGSDLAFTVNVDALEGAAAEMGEELPVEEVRLVDGIVYINEGSQWFALDTDGLLGDLVGDFVDPRSVLDTVQDLTEATEVGTATIDGVETTHFQSVIDLADESLNRAGWLGFEGANIDADGEVTVDLYVDGSGLLRQFDLSGDMQSSENTEESGTFQVSTRFFDVGSDITVEAPADVEPFNPLELLDN